MPIVPGRNPSNPSKDEVAALLLLSQVQLGSSGVVSPAALVQQWRELKKSLEE